MNPSRFLVRALVAVWFVSGAIAGEVDLSDATQDPSLALETFRERLGERPDDALAASGEVQALLALERVDEALERSSVHFEADADNVHVRAAHGSVLFRAGRLPEAERVLAPLADAEATTPRGLVALARLRAAAGRHATAAELTRRALRGGSDDPWVLFWAAETVGDRDRSLELLQRYLEVAPERDEDRIEAARGTLAVQRAIGDREVWVPVDRPERVVLPLRLAWDDSGRKLGYVVEAHLGPKDKPVKLMLDTGSSGLFLVERMARKRGFEFLAEETAFGGGGDKRHRNRRGLFSSFRLGSLRFRDALAGTTRRELEPYGRYHGLLGIQALAGYRATLDLANQQLILELGGENEAADGEPFWMVSGQMLVNALAGEGRRGLFLFDTGATWTILSSRFAAGFEGLESTPTRGVRGFGGKVEGALVVNGVGIEFAGLSSGATDLRAFDMSVRSAVGGVEISGFVGLDLLDRVKITIDTVAQRVRVERSARRSRR